MINRVEKKLSTVFKNSQNIEHKQFQSTCCINFFVKECLRKFLSSTWAAVFVLKVGIILHFNSILYNKTSCVTS